MENNQDTYTYTARSANDPTKVVTFTLMNNHVRVNLTDVMEQAGMVAQAQEKPEEVRRQISRQAKPALTKVAEIISGPVRIYDVNAEIKNEKLNVTLWQRISGLRLAPVQFNMGRIDNEAAAEAFVDELNRRKKNSPYEGRFAGPLDYWLGWAGLFLLVSLLFGWLRKREVI